MNRINHLFIFIILLQTINAATTCEDGWVAYKNELCIKVFPNDLKTYEKAKEFCSTVGDRQSKSSLVMIKKPDLQVFLTNYTADILAHIWLGSRYNYETSQFNWEDGESFTFTNFHQKNSQNTVNSNDCVKLHPSIVSNASSEKQGKWTVADCEERNAVMCQKSLIGDPEAEIRALRNDLARAKSDIGRLKSQLSTLSSKTQKDMKNLDNKLVKLTRDTKSSIDKLNRQLNTINGDVFRKVLPVGFIYVEYSNQTSPQNLWPSLKWQDVTSNYAGYFFRALGGSSAEWGVTQDGCKTQNYVRNEYNTEPADKVHHVGVRTEEEKCEVFPKNQAIKIWKHTDF